jgi:CheY-like chemotaxis protein
MAGESILAVDDNPANLKVVRFLLAARGYDVRTAVDAGEAMAAIRAAAPRLILMDLQLPGVDGLELTRQLKADPATAGILVVALTAYAMKGDEQRAREAGCDAYVAKPIDTRALPGMIASLLAGETPPSVPPGGAAR